jgi:hypothetical protein
MPAGRSKEIHTTGGAVCQFALNITSSTPWVHPFVQRSGLYLDGGLLQKLASSSREPAWRAGTMLPCTHLILGNPGASSFSASLSNHIGSAKDGTQKALVAKFKQASQCPYARRRWASPIAHDMTKIAAKACGVSRVSADGAPKGCSRCISPQQQKYCIYCPM